MRSVWVCATADAATALSDSSERSPRNSFVFAQEPAPRSAPAAGLVDCWSPRCPVRLGAFCSLLGPRAVRLPCVARGPRRSRVDADPARWGPGLVGVW